MINILLFLWLLCYVILVLAEKRSRWLLQELKKLDSKSLGYLPPYSTMFLRFWIWDIEKFKK